MIGRASRRSRPEFPKAFDSFVGTKPVSPVARPSCRVLSVHWLDQSDREWTGERSRDENEESDQYFSGFSGRSSRGSLALYLPKSEIRSPSAKELKKGDPHQTC